MKIDGICRETKIKDAIFIIAVSLVLSALVYLKVERRILKKR